MNTIIRTRSTSIQQFLIPHSSFLIPHLLTTLILLISCSPQAPVIYSIDPQIGIMGEPVIIKGAFFGNDRDESYVTIAGAQPIGKSYLSWQDDKIILRIPEFAEAGLIYVYVKGKKSNGVLFANKATLPSQVQNDETRVGPRIISITPPTASPGALLSIIGAGFGSSRGNSGVFFSWNAQAPSSAPLDARIEEFTEVSDIEFGYELWSDREIRVRVPDGAVGGNMEVRTPRANSAPFVFELGNRPGSKIFRDKRSYTLSYLVDLKVSEAVPPNTMYLWIPRPASSAAQRNIELLFCSMEALIDEYRGVSLFKIDNLSSDKDLQIRLSWKVDVYGIETVITPQSIRQEQDSPIISTYTQSSLQLPCDDPRIQSQIAAILGRERNPYTKAQRIYEWMTNSYFTWEGSTVNPAPVQDDIINALESKHIDSYLGALLYCTLLRAAGVPGQPISGVLVNRNREVMNHYWAEFWIDGIGWIPADPFMAYASYNSGIIPESFIAYQDKKDFYFGNMDSRRIVFSRGWSILSPMDPRGRTAAHNRSWSLQNIREEVVGGIESYSSLWGDITITGIYAQ